MTSKNTPTRTAFKAAASKKAALARKYPWIDGSIVHLAVPIERLKPSEHNPVDHDEANITCVMGRMKDHGQYHPLVANERNNQVVIGNCRLEVE